MHHITMVLSLAKESGCWGPDYLWSKSGTKWKSQGFRVKDLKVITGFM